jgi:hypothetical protein
MERCAEDPIAHFLVVDHDSRFGQESYETVFDAEFDGVAPAIVGASCTPKVKLRTFGFELANMLNHTRHGDSSRADGADESVIDIDVNDHG